MEQKDPSLDLDRFKHFDVPALKFYLKRRNLSTIGRKDVLVARAFAAYEANTPEVLTESERDEIRESDYRKLLKTESEGQLPDPMYDLQEGWLCEKEGQSKWPPCLIEDISFFLLAYEKDYHKVSLTKRLLNDYKEQKAFGYFKSKFLYEVFYHEISQHSQFCFVRAKCVPSMRLKNIPHEAWVCIRKDNGEIKSAYCTCFAGLGETCNHVAALLFRIDDAWKCGAVGKQELACTSKLCTWNVPANKKVEPIRLKDVNVEAPKAEQPQKPRQINVQQSLFGRPKKHKGMTPAEFLQQLAKFSPDSVTLGERNLERHDTYKKWDEAQKKKIIPVPPNVEEIAAECTTIEELYAKFEHIFTPESVNNIEKATQAQGEDVWKTQRKGRVTASKFYRVYTRMNAYEADQEIDMDAVIAEVLQYKTPPENLQALKYGRRMEGIAAKKYQQVLIERGHKEVKIITCGLFVPVKVPFLGASPDRIVTCSCCGKRVLEIKCPLKCAHSIPDDNLDYLISENSKLSLKRNHAYYAQIQGQLGVLGCEQADFFVYSSHGYFLETILFDSQFWEDMSVKLSVFFRLFIAQELITKAVYERIFNSNAEKTPQTEEEIKAPESQSEPQKMESQPEVPQAQANVEIAAPAEALQAVKKNSTKRGKKGKAKKVKVRPVYLCGMCNKRCKDEEDMVPGEESVYCNKCCKWVHMVCAGITEDSSDLEDEEYHCPNCVLKQVAAITEDY